MQALSVEQRMMDSDKFQRICFRPHAEAACSPAFSFATFMHLDVNAFEEGELRLQPQCAPTHLKYSFNSCQMSSDCRGKLLFVCSHTPADMMCGSC